MLPLYEFVFYEIRAPVNLVIALANSLVEGAAKLASRMNFKTCLKRPLSKIQKMIFKTNYRLMKVESSAECSPWSFLQYF